MHHSLCCIHQQYAKKELYGGDTQIEIADGNDKTEAAVPDSNKQTAMQAYINLVRASVGPGMLALPYAFLKVSDNNASPTI